MLFWDVGLPDELIELPNGEDRFDGKFNMKVTKTLKSQFKDSGINPVKINYHAFSLIGIYISVKSSSSLTS